MRKREVEQKLSNAFEHATPDVLGGILAAGQDRKGIVIQMENNRQVAPKKKNWKRAAAAVAAAFVCIVGGAFGYSQHLANSVDSIIALDVNPSLELKVNRLEEVLAVNAINADGEAVIGAMELKGARLDVAVNALIGSMLKQGYISELANSVLITVENGDANKQQELETRLVSDVEQALTAASVSGAVIGQKAPSDAETAALAQNNNISAGKAALIRRIQAQDSLLQFEDLAKLSVNELNLLAQSKNADMSEVVTVGTASTAAYIGEEKAKEFALAHAGVAAADASRIRAELDREDGRMVYEVEFIAGGMEYEYDVDAVDGSIVKAEKERDDDGRGQHVQNAPSPAAEPAQTNAPQATPAAGSQSAQSSASYIGADRAKEIALSHAGVSAADARLTKAELDRENGRMIYEVDFKANGMEYDYEIDAESGTVRKAEKETDD